MVVRSWSGGVVTGIVVALSLLAGTGLVAVPNTFSNGEIASADEINANFKALEDRLAALEDAPDGSVQAQAAQSCYTLKQDNPGLGTSQYYIDPDNDGDTSDAWLAHCDMTTGTGGWTLVGAITRSGSYPVWQHNDNAIGGVSTPGSTIDARLSSTEVGNVLAAGLNELMMHGIGTGTRSTFRILNGEPFGWRKEWGTNWEYSSTLTTTWFAPPATRKTIGMAPQNGSNCFTGDTSVGTNFIPFHYGGGGDSSYNLAIPTTVCSGFSEGRVDIYAR